jgi:hypothetical protein
MASFKEFLTGNTATKTAQKAPVKTGSFSQFLQSQTPTIEPRGPASTSPFNPNTPGHDEFVKQMDQKQGSTSLIKNFFTSIPGALKTVGNTALELPKSLIQPFTNPSPTEQAIEKNIVPAPSNPILKTLTAIPRTIAKGVVRAAEPMVEGLGKEIGTFAADPKNPANLPANSFQSFLHAANVGVALGGSVKILSEELGTKLANTSETLRITPDELRTKLINDEIQHPQAQALARDLVTKNQTLEITGTKPAEGVRGTVGKAIGGVEKAPNPQFKIIDNGEPVAGELNAPQTSQNAPGEAIVPQAVETPTLGTKLINQAESVIRPQQEAQALKMAQKGQERYIPIEQTPLQTPDIQTSKLALGVEAKAVANKLTDSFQGLPEYARVSVADQARAASNLLVVNREQAINIAMGHELPPEGILPESIFVAVENHAIQTGDVALLRDLATSSNLTTEATGMGQRLRMLAERDPNSAVSAIQKVVKIKEAAATRKYGDVKKVKAKIKADIATQIKKTAPKAKDWAGFLSELKCS